jgi:hypothetical protein
MSESKRNTKVINPKHISIDNWTQTDLKAYSGKKKIDTKFKN